MTCETPLSRAQASAASCSSVLATGPVSPSGSGGGLSSAGAKGAPPGDPQGGSPGADAHGTGVPR